MGFVVLVSTRSASVFVQHLLLVWRKPNQGRPHCVLPHKQFKIFLRFCSSVLNNVIGKYYRCHTNSSSKNLTNGTLHVSWRWSVDLLCRCIELLVHYIIHGKVLSLQTSSAILMYWNTVLEMYPSFQMWMRIRCEWEPPRICIRHFWRSKKIWEKGKCNHPKENRQSRNYYIC